MPIIHVSTQRSTAPTMSAAADTATAAATAAAAATATAAPGGGVHSASSASRYPIAATARERTAHAVEYYNNNVLRARVGAGLAVRSSVNERHMQNGRHHQLQQQQQQHFQQQHQPQHLQHQPQQQHHVSSIISRLYPTESLYRSNSSLELVHDSSGSALANGAGHAGHLHRSHINQPAHLGVGNGTHLSSGAPNLRREYGSHGSIDVISAGANEHHRTPNGHNAADGGGHNGSGGGGTSESFFAMLQDYRPAVLGVIGTDQRSPGPAEYLKGKVPADTGNYASINSGPASVHFQSNGGGSALQTSSSITSMQSYANEMAGTTAASLLASANAGTADADRLDSGSPKFKLNRLWGPNSKHSRPPTVSANDECSFITTQSADIEERQRRRAFAHFDCQSLTANLGYAAKLRGLLLARRRNTTTGASAASMINARDSSSSTTTASVADPDSVTSSKSAANAESDSDFGDGQCNDLIENCPYFRNEIGGEDEREVSLTRFHSGTSGQRRAIHRPALACGVSVLECPAGDSLWKQATCPFQKGTRPIESVDMGARYYRDYFLDQEHQNWFGLDEQLGPVAISIKRERLMATDRSGQPTVATADDSKENNASGPNSNASHGKELYQFRMIVRTSELLTLRGSVCEDSVPNPRGPGKPATTKDVLEYVAPEVQLSSLRQGVASAACEQQLLKLDEQGLTNKYKVGILYCKAGQGSEEDMYNNEHAGPAFDEFLDTIGRRVRLRGFEHYRAGLDNKTDSTGTHSLYATMQDCEVMFHVSTMLPFTPNNRQQLLRKRHIGNDIVTIVFQEPGSRPFTPKSIRSQFQHVFIIVRAVNPCTDNTHYRVAVSRSKEVPVFGPPVRAGALFLRSKSFADFLVSKLINAENAAHRSEKFATMATRTRQEYLKDLSANYCTTVPVDTGAKFSLFPSKKNKERARPPFCGDLSQRAAFCWQVVLHDTGQATSVDCFLGISAETFVLIEECSRQIVFVTPCRSILGWSTSGYSIRIFHHQSECVTLSMRESTERDEQLEVIGRLRAVSAGCGAIELSLRRNGAGQLGFHVQPDGVVTQVEPSGQAWSAGLRQGARLVEICKVAVATLSHDEMVDLLKTSTQVTVTVIESFSDGTARKGCFLQNCKFNLVNYEGGASGVGGNAGAPGCGPANTSVVSVAGDYENLDDAKPKLKATATAAAQMKQPGGVSHRRRYERNFSPPRSSNSSGYGTGSSSRSFNLPGVGEVGGVGGGVGVPVSTAHLRTVADMGTLTSSSSGHSSAGGDDRWYDILEVPDSQSGEESGGGGGGQQQQQQQHQHQQHQQHQQQQHHTPQYHHQKITHTSSLPLVNAIRPLSIHEPSAAAEIDHHPSHHHQQQQQQQHHHQQQQQQQQHHQPIIQRASIHHPLGVPGMAKVVTVTEQRPLQRPANGNHEYLVKPPTILTHAQNGAVGGGGSGSGYTPQKKQLLQLGISDGNQTDTSSVNNEPVYSVSLKSVSTNADDESISYGISGHGNGNAANGTGGGHGEMLPLRRASTTSNMHIKHKNANLASSAAASSTSSSRNNSPRTLLNDSSSSSVASSIAAGAGVTKLRPTASASAARGLLQRNSVNYTGSSLQEDLMRLINPDYMGQSLLSGSQAAAQHGTSNDDNFHHGPLAGGRPQKNSANSHSLGNISASVAALNGNGGGALSAAPASALITDELLLMRKKSRSREAINLGSHGMPISDGKFKAPADKSADAVIFTTARPATVINNNNSSSSSNSSSQAATDSPAAPDFLHIREDQHVATAAVRQSTRRPVAAPTDYAAHLFKSRSKDAAAAAATSHLQSESAPPSAVSGSGGLQMPSLPALLGDSKEVDWSRLVDDAIQQVNEGLKQSAEAAAAAAAAANKTASTDIDTDTGSGGAGAATSTSSPAATSSVAHTDSPVTPQSCSVPELQLQVVQLEDRVGKETRRRRSLEQAVRRLTEENRRLQDESQAAVQQLRRFTEWFFQTIDRQN